MTIDNWFIQITTMEGLGLISILFGKRSKIIRKELNNKMKRYSEKVKMVNESESRNRTKNHVIINSRIKKEDKIGFNKSLFAER